MSENRRAVPALLAASVGVTLACTALGAFSGCDLDLVQNARGAAWRGPSPMLLGAISGLLLGLAISLWDRRWAQPPASRRRRFALRSLYALAWLLTALLSSRADYSGARIWKPVSLPLRLDQRNTVSATFIAEESLYDVQVDLKQNLPYEQMQAMIEGPSDPETSPPPPPHRPEIVWRVNSASGADPSLCWQYGGGGSDSIDIRIGEIKTVRGQRYTITAQVLSPSSGMQALDPHLQVELWVGYQDYFYWVSTFAMMGGMIAGVVGLILLIRAILLWRSESAP